MRTKVQGQFGRLSLGATASVLALAIAAPAWAQQDTTADDENAEASTIIVTGSRIRGVEASGSNVITLDEKRIAEEPVNSTNDLLRRVPQVISLGANRAGGTAQNGAANATRGAGINLRGLSTNATLLLYDGKRLPPQGTQGQFTDPAVIPAIALQRVEVVADGTSAIYGSDAVAGVVNLILRKGFTGLEARARYGLTDGYYDERQASVIGGYDWGSGSAMAAVEYTKFNELRAGDLDFYRTDNRDRGGRDLRSRFCNPGTIAVGGANYAIPAGGVTPANAGQLRPGTVNLCDYSGITAVIPEQKRWSLVGSVEQELGDRIKLFADGFWSRRDGVIRGEGTFTGTVPSSNPFFVSPIPGAASVQVTYALTPEYGLLKNPYYSKSYNVSGGAEVELFGDWRARGYYAYGKSDEVADRHLGIDAGSVAAALADTNPATALNVFGGSNNPATIATITDRAFIITGRTRLEVANLQFDGSLFALPGGAVRLAVGGEHRVEYTYTDLGIGTSRALAHVTDSGSRNVDAVFGELYVPLVGRANAMPLIAELSLSAALRYEDYSDFGSTTNPKIGITWAPIAGLRLKGTYGTSFRAPTFTEVSTIAGGAGLYGDTLPGPNGNQIGIGLAGGNPDLQPETATTFSGTIELKPLAMPGFQASVTYFDIDYQDQIQALRGTPGLLTNPIYASFVQFNPTLAQVNALIASGLPINSPITANQVTFIADGRRQNLGTSLFKGIDFTLGYNWAMGPLEFDATVLGTVVLDYQFEAVPGAGFSDVLDTFGFTQSFRSQGSLGIGWNGLRSRVTVNYLTGYDNTTVNPVQQIDSYTTVDLYLGYQVTDFFNLAFDVRNLLDQDPPFVDTTFGYDPQGANPVPRLFSVSVGLKF